MSEYKKRVGVTLEKAHRRVGGIFCHAPRVHSLLVIQPRINAIFECIGEYMPPYTIVVTPHSIRMHALTQLEGSVYVDTKLDWFVSEITNN